MENNKITLILGIASIFMYQVMGASFTYFGVDEESSTASAWIGLGYYFIGLWVIRDKENHHKIYKPFDFGFFVYLFLIVYLPYYVVKTRNLSGFLKFIAILSALVIVGYSSDIFLYLKYGNLE